MVIRKFKEKNWEPAYEQIIKHGRSAPLCLQYDLDVSCNGIDYILKVQPDVKKYLAVLQATRVSYNQENGAKEYALIESQALMSALIEIIIFQGAEKRAA